MKSKNDHFTSEMFGNRPGRPRKANAMTGAQRVAKHRAGKRVISVTCNGKACNTCSNAGVCSGFSAIGSVGRKD